MRSSAAYHQTGNYNWVQSDKILVVVAETDTVYERDGLI